MVTYINDKEPSMFQMWVSPSARNRKVGEKLVLKLKEWVKNFGQSHMVCSVFKENKPALSLYLRLGFVQTHEDDEEFFLRWDF
jgi:ribosomal protein S18 acetylase RimI-like enzyme